MDINTGLFNNMVLQRDKHNKSNAKIQGTFHKAGTIKAIVTHEDKQVEGVTFPVTISKSLTSTLNSKLTTTLVSTLTGTLTSTLTWKFEGTLSGIPVGGPYTIKIFIESDAGKTLESLTVKNVLVGDVWILAGQSNMQGIGLMSEALKPNEMTRAFYVTDEWGVAKDPLHQLYKAVDDVHTAILGATKDPKHIGVGPGVPFAQEMFRINGVPQGLIASAHGGTSMSQWDPALKNEGSRSLYGAMLRRFKKNGSNVAGILWYQGCSDTDENNVDLYTERMKTFVKEVRKDFKDSSLPFVIVQISRVCGNLVSNPKHWNAIQEKQRLLPKLIKNLSVVPAIDLSLDDLIHISGADQVRLGVRLAQAMCSLKFKDIALKPPISLKEVKVIRNKYDNNSVVVITYNNVMGTLEAKGRPNGFEISSNPEFLDSYQIFRTDLDGDKVILYTSFPNLLESPKYLHYGYGIMPYCNITDSSDRALPVMGPIAIPSKSAYTPFVQSMQVSEFQPSSGNLASLDYPASQGTLAFQDCTFGEPFCSIRNEIAKQGESDDVDSDNVVFYKFFLENDEEMCFKYQLGYDGPVKVWVDGVMKFHDLNGTNPALFDDASIPLTLSAGKHEILIALGTNYSKAWGIFVRFERVDLTEELVKKGSNFYQMPRISAT